MQDDNTDFYKNKYKKNIFTSIRNPSSVLKTAVCNISKSHFFNRRTKKVYDPILPICININDGYHIFIFINAKYVKDHL
ncbi:hypothetical protein C922_00435 [Plasmodium inui San Antonio 1]|uniref:Uncharacterized protein n=1 Tax=Plasmodium inui San Antonio 1 TaxID=1237626 RepID=W7AVZ2_9APIC|nr:hypothetical protein C922_00435 [Plasmodium inui San Antonio 1]EUD69571.1 hypothetical protein C922_00435 [Plasmodium inui San Antonio 1]